MKADFTLSKNEAASRYRLGVIILQNDASLEVEFPQALHASGAVCHYSRIPSPAHITPETLQQMRTALPQAIELLPSFLSFSAIGYACTSGALMIGSDNIAKMVKKHHPQAHYTDPMQACLAACKALRLQRIAYLSPYLPQVSLAMREALQAHKVQIPAFADFEQGQEATVAAISEKAVLKAVCELGKQPDCQAVFISCTNLRSFAMLKRAEQIIGKPVLSSNQVLIWQLLRLSQCHFRPQALGSLLAVA